MTKFNTQFAFECLDRLDTLHKMASFLERTIVDWNITRFNVEVTPAGDTDMELAAKAFAEGLVTLYETAADHLERQRNVMLNEIRFDDLDAALLGHHGAIEFLSRQPDECQGPDEAPPKPRRSMRSKFRADDPVPWAEPIDPSDTVPADFGM